MALMNPLVSAIIPTYNHGEFIEDAIESVLGQTYRYLEMIVIDDGSTDRTKKILERYQGRVKCVYQNHRGVSSARNHGIRISTGKYIAFLDADDIWLPEKVEAQVGLMENDQQIGLVACGVYMTNALGEVERQRTPRGTLSHEELREQLQTRNDLINSSSALIKRECFTRVGEFDERLRFGEDWDMWLRITKYYRANFLEKPLVKIRRQPRSKSYHKENILRADITRILETNLSREAKRLRRKAYGYLYLDLSSLCRNEDRNVMAMIYALRSLGSYPFKLPQGDYRIPLLLNSILGDRFYHKLRRLKETLSPAKRAMAPKENVL